MIANVLVNLAMATYMIQRKNWALTHASDEQVEQAHRDQSHDDQQIKENFDDIVESPTVLTDDDEDQSLPENCLRGPAKCWQGVKQLLIDIHVDKLTPCLVSKRSQSSIQHTSLFRSSSLNDAVDGLDHTIEADEDGEEVFDNGGDLHGPEEPRDEEDERHTRNTRQDFIKTSQGGTKFIKDSTQSLMGDESTERSQNVEMTEVPPNATDE